MFKIIFFHQLERLKDSATK